MNGNIMTMNEGGDEKYLRAARGQPVGPKVPDAAFDTNEMRMHGDWYRVWRD